MNKFVPVGLVAALVVIGASAIAGADDPPGVNSPVDVASARAERAFPSAAQARDLYGALRRPAAADDRLPHASQAETSRAVNASGKARGVFLSQRGDELCVVKVGDADTPGGTACDDATDADGRPPFLVLGYGPPGGEHTVTIYGAAPDGATSVRLVDGTGSAQEVPVVDNAYTVKLPPQRASSKLVRDLQFVWQDDTVSTLINDGAPR